MPLSTPLLFLFDIDGTMLVTGGSGYRSFLRSCSEVVGIDGPIDGIHMAGKLDRGIFQQIIDTYRPDTSAEESDKHWIAFRKRYVELLELESRDTSGWTLLPGIREVVERTNDLGKLALLTGNVRECAMMKIKAFGLEGYFPAGGYGEQDISRGELAKLAYEDACEHYGIRFAPERTYVLGDTVNDVLAARAIGAHAIAVATGTVTFQELAAAEPELLLQDFSSGAQQFYDYLSC
jgi:phosphoglycolate phosphatase